MDEIKPTKVVMIDVNKPNHSEVVDENMGEQDQRLIGANALSDDYMHYRLYSFFNLENRDSISQKKNEQVKAIHDWARVKSGSNDADKISNELLHLEQRLGTPSIGVSRLNHLYQYVRINSKVKDLEEQQTRLLRRY